MHREYRPADMHDLRVHAFGDEADQDHHHDSHEHDHARDHDDRGLYILTGLLGLLLGADVFFGGLGWESWRAPGGISLALVAAVVGGRRIVYGALEALVHGRIGADIALAQACLAALVIGQPFVAAEVVFIALVGEVLEAVTFERARKAIHRLLDQTPETARVRRDGEEIEIPAGQVVVGDLVIVRAGERIPVEGPVVLGRSSVDQSALTGESLPVDKGPGDPVYTGTLNQFGVIEVRAEKVGHETTFGQVLRLVGEAQRKKAPLERTADRLARYFLPVVEIVAGLTLLGRLSARLARRLAADGGRAGGRLPVRLDPGDAGGGAGEHGLAGPAWRPDQGGAALERLAECDTFAFDKTGTLTHGRPELASVLPAGSRLRGGPAPLAATAEAASPHPLAEAVTREAKRRGVPPFAALEAVAQPGAGVSARFVDEGQEHAVLVGNRRLLSEAGISIDPETGQRARSAGRDAPVRRP